jgi:dCTP deaminase
MILTDSSILELIQTKNLITGYADLDKQLQPASFDIRLQDSDPYRAYRPKDSGIYGPILNPDNLPPHEELLRDLYRPMTRRISSTTGNPFWLLGPDDFVIASTEEVVNVPDDIVCVVDGCSTLGRLGVLVHITAGFIDPGFRGRVTLEIKNVSPHTIRLRPHMRIGQFVFYQGTRPALNPYRGRYQGQDKPLIAQNLLKKG